MSEMSEIKMMLSRLLNKLELIYPNTNDSDATYATAITATASSTTTLTLSFGAEWRIVVSSIYADAATYCTYKWYYKGKAVTGNVIEFVKRQLFTRPEQIILKVTNAGASNQSIDVLVKAFGRLIQERGASG